MTDSDLRAQLSLSLGGGYIIDRELETTGRSRLFIARELTDDREVVVKVLPDEVTSGVDAERFAREVHLVSALQEPHTVPILASGLTASGSTYYVMPYIAEPSLGHRLEEAPVAFDDAIIALRDLARAMEHAHRHGIVHGDIKPENVFLIKGTAVVTDFGVATALESARGDAGERGHLRLVTTSASATAYIAPEHVSEGREVDHRADIYAWGVMAYELLYDVHPFPNVSTVGELLEAHLHAPPPVPPHKAFGVPEQLATLVMRCLAKDPAQRPASASELLAVLQRIPSGAAALAVESWSPYRLIGMAFLAFGAFLGLVFAIWRLQSVGSPEMPLVAVLPFESSGSATDSAFADALATGVTRKLQRLDGIRVVDIASAHSRPAATGTPWEVGKALGAQYVLYTTARWFKDVDGTLRVQLSPSLLQVSDGSTKWTGPPEIAFPADPFTPQSSIATQAAQELGVAIGAPQKLILAERGTTDTAAFNAFIKGDALYWRGVEVLPEFARDTRPALERAFTLDPRYADALGTWAAVVSDAAMHHSTPEMLDSISRNARRALALIPDHTRALIASGRVALLRDRQDEALAFVGRALEGNPSDVEALQLRCDLLLLVGDSAAVWRDIERIVRIAPRSPNALLRAANTAIALRRFSDAREFVRRARALQPRRADLILSAAQLSRQSGNIAEMIRLTRDARFLGGSLTTDDVALLRSGDKEMQDELASSSADTYHAATPADSFQYYMEKSKLFMSRHDDRVTAVVDSAGAELKHILSSRATTAFDHRRFAERAAWIDAASGDRTRVTAAMTDLPPSINVQRFPNGAFAAFVACNDAEIYALGGDVDRMLPRLERCLTLPGGYAVSAIPGEPALARFTRDPRLGGMLGRLGLDLDRQ